ncbi:MAG TPA: M1 family aminopeptidase [Thermoanaerobaculia bacterium]|nr:M1 family aminopeptidase [Thermoanaerobaculia bacterium]
MPQVRLLTVLLILLLPASARGTEPAALRREIGALRLVPERAVTLDNVKLAAGLAQLQLKGILFPTTPVGGKVVEMVFLGEGRVTLEPPDPVEAGQLELFTGQSRLDAEFGEAVLVVGLDAAVEAMLGKTPVEPDVVTAARAEVLYDEWRGRREREVLGVERSLLADALGDPGAEGYFAALFRGAEPGDFVYLVDPASREQVTLGRFTPLDATEKEKRRILKEISREQRKGRLIGLEQDDLGTWDTWLSASLRNAQGQPRPGSPAFEPSKYTLDVTVDEKLRLSGSARIDLATVIPGSRSVLIRVADLEVSKVTDAMGADLFFQTTPSANELAVVLPAGLSDAPAIVVHFESRPIEKDWNVYRLLDTQSWYPQTGEVSRAAHDVTFHWPKGLDLMAAGRLVDGGEAGGQRWERRVFDVPILAYTFELGNFDLVTAKAGHVDIRFAFGAGATLTGRGTRESVMQAVKDSLTYFEEIFGPYPFDELTVVTASRGFSQSLPGFMTLSDFILNDLGMWNRFYGLEDRRLVVAHEMAHQWWGDHVGWASYRDQWMSEALASYSALLFARERLNNELSGVNLTEGWYQAVSARLPDGSTIESVGPIVLGWRLISSRASDAYQPIVYMKGAVIMDMLAHSLGEDVFPKVLRQVVKAWGGRTISTEDLFSAIETVTSTDLDPFTAQYVYGTGLPEVLYSARFEKTADGWLVKGTARQQTTHRMRYKVVPTQRGTFDVVLKAARQVDIEASTVVVPVTIGVYNPGAGKAGRDGTNGAVKGNIVLKGETTEFAINVKHEPRRLWLDKDKRVFASFLDESRHPKWFNYLQGQTAALAGDSATAAAFYDKALAAKEPPPDNRRTVTYDDLKRRERQLNAWIELSRARLQLDRGDEAAAEAAIGRAQRTLGDDHTTVRVLRARLEIRRGDYEKAWRRLRKGVIASEMLDTSEAYVLLAVAAQKAGHADDFLRALKRAKDIGADVSALTGS